LGTDDPAAGDAAAGDGPRVVLARDGSVTYEPGFLDAASADRAYAALAEEAAWRQESIVMFGRRVPLPRLTAWHGEPEAVYGYSGLLNVPEPWTPQLSALRERLADRLGIRFNSVLLNWYRGGSDAMGWHADDEPELGREPSIASLSLGATRTFELEHRTDRERVAVPLEHGSLLVMTGATQHRWRHRVPKQRRIEGGRINLTFRTVPG
jgi:alkylated DNA repair dioxygenase AlkB